MKTRSINDIYTLLVIFQNYMKLYRFKGWCNGDRIFKYHSLCKSLTALAFLRLPILTEAFACCYGPVRLRDLCESELGQLECRVVQFWPSFVKETGRSEL